MLGKCSWSGGALFVTLLVSPPAPMADTVRTAQSRERAVELIPLCFAPNGKSTFGTEDLAKANCQSGFGKMALPGCPTVWQCKAPPPKTNYSQEFRTQEEAKANCANGLVRRVLYPGSYWVCDPIPPGTSAAKDIFQEQAEDAKKEYDQMIDKLYSGQKDAVKLPAENPFKKASDTEKPPLQSQPASAETNDPSRRGKKGGKPPIVCPPNPAGCIMVKELGKSSAELASKFIQSCSGVTISFKWQKCGSRFCTEYSEHMSEGESFINYTSKTYPTTYDVTCEAP